MGFGQDDKSAVPVEMLAPELRQVVEQYVARGGGSDDGARLSIRHYSEGWAAATITYLVGRRRVHTFAHLKMSEEDAAAVFSLQLALQAPKRSRGW